MEAVKPKKSQKFEYPRWLTKVNLARYLGLTYQYVFKHIEEWEAKYDLGLTRWEKKYYVDRFKVDKAINSGKMLIGG